MSLDIRPRFHFPLDHHIRVVSKDYLFILPNRRNKTILSSTVATAIEFSRYEIVGEEVGMAVASLVLLRVGAFEGIGVEGFGVGEAVSSTKIVALGVGGMVMGMLSDILCPIDIDIDIDNDIDMLKDLSSRATPMKGSKCSASSLEPPLKWAELPEAECLCCVRFRIGAASLAAAPQSAWERRTRSSWRVAIIFVYCWLC